MVAKQSNMKQWGLLCVAIVVTLFHSTNCASLGDGTYSILTGRLVNKTSNVGSCVLDGFVYPSETAVPRQHPCHYCICVQGSLQCYWKSCPLPPEDCITFSYEGVCDPSLYICAIPDILKSNKIGRSLARSSIYFPVIYRRRRRQIDVASFTIKEDFPIEKLHEYVSHKEKIKRSLEPNDTYNHLREKGCNILGVHYRVGEVIGIASDHCMDCRCANQEMFCSPKCCFKPAQVNLDPQFALRSQDASQYIAPNPLQHIKDQLLTPPSRSLTRFFV